MFPLFYSHRWMKASWNPPFPDLQMYNIWHGMVWYVGFFPLFPWPLTGQSLLERRHQCTRLLTWLVRRDLGDVTQRPRMYCPRTFFLVFFVHKTKCCIENVRGQYIRYTHKTSSYIKSSYKRSSYQRPVTERPAYKTSRKQNVQLANVQIQKVQDTKPPGYKTSSYQTSSYRTSRIQNVQDTKRPVFVNFKTCL